MNVRHVDGRVHIAATCTVIALHVTKEVEHVQLPSTCRQDRFFVDRNALHVERYLLHVAFYMYRSIRSSRRQCGWGLRHKTTAGYVHVRRLERKAAGRRSGTSREESLNSKGTITPHTGRLMWCSHDGGRSGVVSSVHIDVSGVCPLYVRGMFDVCPPGGESRTQRRTGRRAWLLYYKTGKFLISSINLILLSWSIFLVRLPVYSSVNK